MWPSNWKTINSETPDLLLQCRGYRGQVCEYLVGHSQLLARFYAARPLADTLLYCAGCDEVRFHASWKDADVRVAISCDQKGQIFTITDGDRLFIVCRVAQLAESRDIILSMPRLPNAT